MSNPAIALQKITKRFGSVTALNDISLTIQAGEFFSLLGPSGCGKTTLLRLLGGFEVPDEGEILLSGNPMRGVPPQDRPVNTVFQNYALFPHLSVYENIAFGLRMKRVRDEDVKHRTEAVLDLVHISDLSKRFPAQLSGGQKQRVALARAIVNEPAVLLLDEPLAAIDAKLRAQLQTELRSLQRKLRTTFVYVTHDQGEALAMSDRIAVLQAGQIAQSGSPAEIYERPRNRFVASFLGGCNILTGKVISRQPATTEVETQVGTITVGTEVHSSQACLGIRRERLRFVSHGESGGINLMPGIIRDRAYAGAETEYSVEVNGTFLNIWVPRAEAQRDIGDRVVLSCAPEDITPLEDE